MFGSWVKKFNFEKQNSLTVTVFLAVIMATNAAEDGGCFLCTITLAAVNFAFSFVLEVYPALLDLSPSAYFSQTTSLLLLLSKLLLVDGTQILKGKFQFRTRCKDKELK